MEDKEEYIKVKRHNANKPVVVYSGSMIQQNHRSAQKGGWIQMHNKERHQEMQKICGKHKQKYIRT